MKRIIISGYIILVLSLIVFVSYAEMQKIVISRANLSDLKGKWTGNRTVGTDTRNTDLEISNDSVPLQCKFTFYDVVWGGRAARTETYDWKARINDQGNLFLRGGNLDLELSLFEDGGKKKLEGNYFWGGVKGTLLFKKR